MADRETKERKLMALMVNDLGPGFGKREMANLKEEVSALSDPDLDETLREGWISPIPRAKRRSCRPCHMSRNAQGVIRRPSPAPPT
jgi:hypothetical protein